MSDTTDDRINTRAMRASCEGIARMLRGDDPLGETVALIESLGA